MSSQRSLLEEMAKNKDGVVVLRNPMGAAGEAHRHRAKLAKELVKKKLARWFNIQRTMVQITTLGRTTLED